MWVYSCAILDLRLWSNSHKKTLSGKLQRWTSDCGLHMCSSTGHADNMVSATCLGINQCVFPHWSLRMFVGWDWGNRGQLFSLFLGCIFGVYMLCVEWCCRCEIALLPWYGLRKQLYPLGKGNYPTLVQKNFNGSEPGLDLDLNPAVALSFVLLFCSTWLLLRKQLSWQNGWKVFAFLWLKVGLTMSMTSFSRCIVIRWHLCTKGLFCDRNYHSCEFKFLRLRAAVFVNLVAMRDAISNSRNDGPVMCPQNIQTLQNASFLWHSARNCLALGWVDSTSCDGVLFFSQGLALEAIQSEKLLWKIRPKHHKCLGMI